MEKAVLNNPVRRAVQRHYEAPLLQRLGADLSGADVFEEVTSPALARVPYRLLFEHPTEDRFSGAELVEELERQGLYVGGRHTQRFFGDFVIGVAERR